MNVGDYQRLRIIARSLWTKIKWGRLSEHKCQLLLRQLHQLQPQDWEEGGDILLPILYKPQKFSLLRPFVLAGQWQKFESLRVPGVDRHGGKTFGDIVELDSSHLVARDKFRECLHWEASLTPTLRAARCGDVATFKAEVSADPSVLEATDFMNNDIWFWALTGGDVDIIDYLLQVNVSLHWFVYVLSIVLW